MKTILYSLMRNFKVEITSIVGSHRGKGHGKTVFMVTNGYENIWQACKHTIIRTTLRGSMLTAHLGEE